MTKLMKKQSGFTLIELMIVVVIIGILAAVAIPQFLKYQLKSKTTEASRSLGAIKTNEEAFAAKWNVFGFAAYNPSDIPTAAKAAWVPTPNAGFELLGFSPAGQVYYGYAVNAWQAAEVDPGLLTCGVTGGIDAALNITGTVITILNSVARNPDGTTNSIQMAAKGDLDDDGVFSCFVMGDVGSDIVPVPGAAGDSVF